MGIHFVLDASHGPLSKVHVFEDTRILQLDEFEMHTE